MLWLDLLFFVIACVVLSQCSVYLVKSLAKLSGFFRLNEFTIGFILVAVATSLPETFLGIISALTNKPGFSVGNVIGSNIIDLTLIIGIGALLAKKITIESKIIKKDLFYMLFIAILPAFLLSDYLIWQRFGFDVKPGLSRIDGIILLCVFVFYIIKMIRQETKFSKIDKSNIGRAEAFRNFLLFLLTMALLLVSAKYVVETATRLSYDLGVSEFIVGIFLISLGTTLPELVFTVRSVLDKHGNMAIGDIVGSVIINSTLVLGVTATINPVFVDPGIYLTSTLFMVFAAFIFLTFAESDEGINWKEGISLILLYFLFVIVETYVRAL
jgi:cation:H+ antiporter